MMPVFAANDWPGPAEAKAGVSESRIREIRPIAQLDAQAPARSGLFKSGGAYLLWKHGTPDNGHRNRGHPRRVILLARAGMAMRGGLYH